MKIRKIIVRFLSKTSVIENWDTLEVVAGKPCNSLSELLSEVNSKIKSLQTDLFQANNCIQALETKLFEKQAVTPQIEKPAETPQNSHLEKLLERKGEQINSTLKHLIELQELVDRTEFDNRMNKENTLQAIMKLTEAAIEQLGVVIMNSVGETYDSRFQTVVTVQETDNPKEDNIVSDSLRRGYRKDNYCIREQEVIVYQFNG